MAETNDQNLTFNGHKMMREYRAQVVNTDDPERLLRVQVRIPIWWDAVPDDDLPWAEYKFNDARARGGLFIPAEVEDWVWIDFPNGDTRYPRIVGWCHFAPDFQPDQPHEAWEGPEQIEHKLDEVIEEPEPQKPNYHESLVLEKHGVTVEINKSGEVLITQRETGTAVRITEEGDITLHCEHVQYFSSVSDTLQHVGRDEKAYIDRDQRFEIARDQDFEIGQDQTFEVARDQTMEIGQDESITVGRDQTMNIGRDESITVGRTQTMDVGEDQSVSVGRNRILIVGNDNQIDIGGRSQVTIGDDSRVTIGNRSEVRVSEDSTVLIEGNSDWRVTNQKFMQFRTDGRGLIQADEGLVLKGASRTLVL